MKGSQPCHSLPRCLCGDGLCDAVFLPLVCTGHRTPPVLHPIYRGYQWVLEVQVGVCPTNGRLGHLQNLLLRITSQQMFLLEPEITQRYLWSELQEVALSQV